MRRGFAGKKRRQDSAAACQKSRDVRTDDRQIDKLNAGNHRAVKERARLAAKYADEMEGKL